MLSSSIRVLAAGMLLTTLACGESSGPGPVGAIAIDVQTVFAGLPVDPDGYQVTVDGQPVASVASSGQVTVGSVPAGVRSVRLTDVAEGCVAGDNPRVVTVEPDTTVTVPFVVSCGDGTGSVRIQVATSGPSPDPDGYTIIVSGQVDAIESTGSTGEVVIDHVLPGNITARIDGIALNCALVGPGQQDAAVPLGGQALVQFEVACTGPLPYDLIFQAAVEPFGSGDIYRVNASGIGLRNLTMSDAYETFPDWSPDGTRIVFNRSPDLNPGNLFVMQADGAGATDLGVAAAQADWSPDQAKFAAFVDRNIFLLESDGTGLTQLTGVTCERFVDSCLRLTAPGWSPDGSRILYQVRAGFPVVHACSVIDTDGTDETRLNESCLNPTWSPDGTRIAYDFNGHIMLMDADGGNIVDLSLVTDPFTASPGVTEQFPAWSPDGALIAFVSTRPIPEEAQGTGGPHLFVMNANGTGVRHVTIGPDLVDLARPRWGPAGP